QQRLQWITWEEEGRLHRCLASPSPNLNREASGMAAGGCRATLPSSSLVHAAASL
ncbi:unnamed protein product, partial [Bubo scandiacus]